MLLEHRSFTDVLWSVFHATEELLYRADLTIVSLADVEHLANDIRWVYTCLILEWLEYLWHLKQAYPYLFSLAIRVNPFNPKATVEVNH